MTCAVERDLGRYQAEVDAEAEREARLENDWPELKAEVVEQVMLRQSIRVNTNRFGERCLIDWSDITSEVCCQKRFELALATLTEDTAEGGRLMLEALRDEAEAQVEANRDDLLDDHWRAVQEDNELARYGL